VHRHGAGQDGAALGAGGADGAAGNREEFPIEVTLSPFEVGGERYHTLILRDVNERNRIEAE
jgi:hypothetical protein